MEVGENDVFILVSTEALCEGASQSTGGPCWKDGEKLGILTRVSGRSLPHMTRGFYCSESRKLYVGFKEYELFSR